MPICSSSRRSSSSVKHDSIPACASRVAVKLALLISQKSLPSRCQRHPPRRCRPAQGCHPYPVPRYQERSRKGCAYRPARTVPGYGAPRSTLRQREICLCHPFPRSRRRAAPTTLRTTGNEARKSSEARHDTRGPAACCEDCLSTEDRGRRACRYLFPGKWLISEA